MTAENAGRRGWMLVRLVDEKTTKDVAQAIWEANEADWLKAKDSEARLGWVSRADVVRLDAAMAQALGCKEAIMVPVTLEEDATPEDAIEAIKGFAGKGAEVFWLQALAHNPETAWKDLEVLSSALPVPKALDKEESSEDTPLDKLRGHIPWG